jgi:ABC-2 type transport system ATP-binding protein
MYNHIRFDNVSLRFNDKTILKNISFRLETNKIYGLLGRNGAGKTTLLSVLGGFVKPNNGSVTIDGKAIFENEDFMESIVFVRDVELNESEKVMKFIKQTSVFRPNFDLEYAMKLVKRFNLPKDGDVTSLSRGMLSALHVVIGLASRCPITIFDEAYLGMDAPSRVLFYEEVLNEYIKHPRTFILSTHLISEMETMFEEVIIIDQGSIIIHEDLDTFKSHGVSVTGSINDVDVFTVDKTILKEQVLGGTKQAMIYGELTNIEKQQAQHLKFDSISLQELFIHLTKEAERYEKK